MVPGVALGQPPPRWPTPAVATGGAPAERVRTYPPTAAKAVAAHLVLPKALVSQVQEVPGTVGACSGSLARGQMAEMLTLAGQQRDS
jgi:hypothetical protein